MDVNIWNSITTFWNYTLWVNWMYKKAVKNEDNIVSKIICIGGTSWNALLTMSINWKLDCKKVSILFTY